MKCKQVREEFFGLASATAASPAIDDHVRHCVECGQKLAEFRQTMSLLDEWKAPEPSPYFDARLGDAISPFTATGRRVALGIAMTLLLGIGVALFQPSHAPKQAAGNPPVATGSAVSDLQALDKNADLYENFDLLDDVKQ
jgi:hypothetical protein